MRTHVSPLSLRGASATKQSRVAYAALDCFAEPVIGPRFAQTRWLAMTAGWLFQSRIWIDFLRRPGEGRAPQPQDFVVAKIVEYRVPRINFAVWVPAPVRNCALGRDDSGGSGFRQGDATQSVISA